jgi:hypothetical protein
MRLVAASLVLAALLVLSATAAVAGPGCAGYKAVKVTYPASALAPPSPQTPIPSSRAGG